MIDLNDYSKTAAQHGWGAGWPSCGGARRMLIDDDDGGAFSGEPVRDG